jgi:hypothetical protein
MPVQDTTRIERMLTAILNLALKIDPSKEFVFRCYDKFESALEEYVDYRIRIKLAEHERRIPEDEVRRDSYLDEQSSRRDGLRD